MDNLLLSCLYTYRRRGDGAGITCLLLHQPKPFIFTHIDLKSFGITYSMERYMHNDGLNGIRKIVVITARTAHVRRACASAIFIKLILYIVVSITGT